MHQASAISISAGEARSVRCQNSVVGKLHVEAIKFSSTAPANNMFQFNMTMQDGMSAQPSSGPFGSVPRQWVWPWRNQWVWASVFSVITGPWPR